MKHPRLIILCGLALAAGGFGVLYASRTAPYRQLEMECGPDLAWIKKEFRLDKADFERVRVLHEQYKVECAEYCRQIDAKHRALSLLLATSTNVTPEIEKVLNDAAMLRKQCHTTMLRHFFAVSRAMPPEQGRRYLAWMQAETLSSTHPTMLPHTAPSARHDANMQ